MDRNHLDGYSKHIQDRVYSFGIKLQLIVEALDFLGLTPTEIIWTLETASSEELLAYLRQANSLKASIYHQRNTDLPPT